MKLTITSLLAVASMSAAVHASFRLRAAGEPSKAMITTPSDQSIDNNNERELLSPWCDPTTPVDWHPDDSQPWSTSGCVQKADCDSPGYDNQATCCAAQYGGQTDGACSSVLATPVTNLNAGKFYADYDTTRSTTGCKNTVPHPKYATILYTTLLECCMAAFGGQTSNACVMGLPSPPTTKPYVAPTTVAPTTKLPTTNIDLSSDNNDGRELLSSWCDPATPVLWHPDYSQSWPISGCVQMADCDSPGYADQATCCSAQYGGQTGGACSTAATPTANPNNGKFYADYSTAWPNGGCKNTTPLPIHATMFYATQLECCEGAFGGQSSNACVMGLPNPPTAKPSVAPTTVAPTTKSPTTLAGQGGGWYADYGTPWLIAGCKNTTPLPIHATMFYATQLACCKGAFGGQTSNACVMGLPNPPTAKPSVAGQGGGWYADYGTAWPNAGCKNTTPLPIHATIFYATQLACCKGAFGGQLSGACIKGLPNPPTKSPNLKPSSKPSLESGIIVNPTANPSTSKPTTSTPTESPTSSPTAIPSTSPTQSPTNTPTESPTASPTQSPITPKPTNAKYCFPDKGTLQTAVDSYISQNCATNSTCTTRTQYGEIGTWCVKLITSMSLMFYGKTTFNSDISNWDVSSVKDMTQMFNSASIFNSNISSWNVSSVYSIASMFEGASSFNSDISKWEVSSVTYMQGTFRDALSFNSDISNWNVSSVTTVYAMFAGASSFNSDISNWNIARVTDMRLMFLGASRFNQNLCPWGPKLPLNFVFGYSAGNMFDSSGCLNKNRPLAPTGPWCAVTNCTA